MGSLTAQNRAHGCRGEKIVCGVSLPQPHHDHDRRQEKPQLQPSSYSSSASLDKISVYILGYSVCHGGKQETTVVDIALWARDNKVDR